MEGCGSYLVWKQPNLKPGRKCNWWRVICSTATLFAQHASEGANSFCIASFLCQNLLIPSYIRFASYCFNPHRLKKNECPLEPLPLGNGEEGMGCVIAAKPDYALSSSPLSSSHLLSVMFFWGWGSQCNVRLKHVLTPAVIHTMTLFLRIKSFGIVVKLLNIGLFHCEKLGAGSIGDCSGQIVSPPNHAADLFNYSFDLFRKQIVPDLSEAQLRLL